MSTVVTVSIRIPEGLREQFDRVAAVTGRSHEALVEEALRHYIEEDVWHIQAIQEALDDYRSGKAVLVPHEEVVAHMEEREAEILAAMNQRGASRD